MCTIGLVVRPFPVATDGGYTVATRKKTTRKKTTRKKATRKKAVSKSPLDLLEASLPKDLRTYAHRMRRNLARIEKQIETARLARRRRFVSMLKEASHRLGRLEAEGEKRFRQQTTKARRDAVKLLHRIERAIEPKPKRKAARKKAASRA